MAGRASILILMNEPAVLAAERAVPRYTSYPTAPHFTGAVGPETYAAWLAALPANASLSLYLHVPFCKELCHYCGCHTKATRRDEPVAAYAERLRDEIELLAAVLPGRRVTHLHWGGGTPSILGGRRLREITTLLRSRFNFADVREHAIELDPRHVTQELVDALAGIGVNRASLGVQDLSYHVQRSIGRVQPFEVVARSARMLRDAGIGKINCDLMYGLPRQSLYDVEATVRSVAALRPQRIAIFGYAHGPWFKKNQRLINAAELPEAGERLAQAEIAHRTLISLGYEPIGLDHFALPDDELAVAARAGRLHRNFQGYTVDDADALLGLGASAIGRLPQGYVQNAPDVAGYGRCVQSGQFATVKGLELSGDDRTRAAIIERLMCDLAVDIADVAEGSVPFAEELERLMPIEAEGLVQIDGPRIRVTEKGRPFVRLVAAAFDRHLQDGRGRHARAV
jgi:oxygen-independent coproporphyrinogen III oxidase